MGVGRRRKRKSQRPRFPSSLHQSEVREGAYNDSSPQQVSLLERRHKIELERSFLDVNLAVVGPESAGLTNFPGEEWLPGEKQLALVERFIERWGQKVPGYMADWLQNSAPARNDNFRIGYEVYRDVRYTRKAVIPCNGQLAETSQGIFNEHAVHGIGFAFAVKGMDWRLYPVGLIPEKDVLAKQLAEYIKEHRGRIQIGRKGRERLIRSNSWIAGGYDYSEAIEKFRKTWNVALRLREIGELVNVPSPVGFVKLTIDSSTNLLHKRRGRLRVYGIPIMEQPSARDVHRMAELYFKRGKGELSTREYNNLSQFVYKSGVWSAGVLAAIGKWHTFGLVHAQPHLGNFLLSGDMENGFNLLVTDLGEFYDISRHGTREELIEAASRKLLKLSPVEIAQWHSLTFFWDNLLLNMEGLIHWYTVGDNHRWSLLKSSFVTGLLDGINQYYSDVAGEQYTTVKARKFIIGSLERAMHLLAADIPRQLPLFREIVEGLAAFFCCRSSLRKIYMADRMPDNVPSLLKEVLGK